MGTGKGVLKDYSQVTVWVGDVINQEWVYKNRFGMSILMLCLSLNTHLLPKMQGIVLLGT